MMIAAQTMTLDDFLKHHEHDPILEYERGVVIEKMPPAWNHGTVAGVIGLWINGFVLPRKLAFAIPELRTTDLKSGVSRVPDVSVYLWDRIERDPKRQQRGAFIPPDIAIEIASPGPSRRKQIDRCRKFVALGAPIALMVDPATESIVDVRPDREERRLRGDDVLDLGDVIPGLALVVSELFATLHLA